MKQQHKQLVLEYLNQDLNKIDDADKYINAMLNLASTSSSLGSNLVDILSSLNYMQKNRLNSLKKELKNGLDDVEKPFGFIDKNNIHSPYLQFTPRDTQSKEIIYFLTQLNSLNTVDIGKKEQALLIRTLQSKIERFQENEIKLKYYITTQEEKKAWNMIVMRDPSKMDKFEVDDIILKMQLALTKHAKKLKENRDYFTRLDGIEESFVKVTSQHLDKQTYTKVREKYQYDKYHLKKPNNQDMISDVAHIKGFLEDKLEKLPLYLSDQQQKTLSDFLPMLREYYEDQYCALSEEKKYLPLAQDLQEIQESMDNKTVAEFLTLSNQLGYTMQHLYLLHWIAEELMKRFQKLSLTLGRNILKRKKSLYKHKKLQEQYDTFFKGVIFRNNVAHNGIIWDPKGFETSIKQYTQGLHLLAEDFDKNLKNEMIPKRREVTLSKRDEFAQKYFNLMFDPLLLCLEPYNSKLLLLTSEDQKLSDDYKPASSTLNYLQSLYAKGDNLLSEQIRLEKIKNIISECINNKSTHEE